MRRQLVALGEGQPVRRHLGQVVEHRDPVRGRVECRGAVGDLDEQAARLADQQRQQMMRGDQVCFHAEPQDAQARAQIMLPDRGVPVSGPALELLGAPDVVDQHVEAAVLVADAPAQLADLLRVEVIDSDRDAGAAQAGSPAQPCPRSSRDGRSPTRPGRLRCCARCR